PYELIWGLQFRHVLFRSDLHAARTMVSLRTFTSEHRRDARNKPTSDHYSPRHTGRRDPAPVLASGRGRVSAHRRISDSTAADVEIGRASCRGSCGRWGER